MRDRWRVVALALMLGLAPAPGAQASLGARDHDGTYLGEATEIKGKGSMSDGSTFNRQGQRCIAFQPGDFLSIGGTTPVPVSGNTTTPGLMFQGSKAALVWHDNETSKGSLRFRVPDGYVSGGAFKALVGRRNLGGSPWTTPTPALDFEVFVDKDETAFDTAATDQTAVQIGTTVADGSPEELTLAVTTDFASLAEGDWVTLNIWRDNVNTSVDSLLVFGLEFCYTGWE